MLIPKHFTLSRRKTLSFLDTLEGDIRNAATLYLPANASTSETEKMLATVPGLSGVPSEAAELAVKSPTGAVLFWGIEHKTLILPPFPVTEKHIASGYEVDFIESLIKRDYTVALVLVRLGSYAVGVCQGEKLVASKVGTGLVHARHRQGGSSAGRFARHREKQIEGFLTRVCGHTREKLEPYARTVDYIAYGGARSTILLLQKQCSFLERFDNFTLPPLLDIPDPRQAVLEEGVRRVWSSQVVEWVDMAR
jgi:hypothetical protein